MERVVFGLLLSICAVALAVFIFEGKEDRQDMTSAMEVGAGTARDLAESATIPLDVSEEDEAEIGDLTLARFLARFPALPETDRRSRLVARIGTRLAKQCRRAVNYRFYVVDTWLVNAFALPGGHVIATCGLVELVANEDELAYVLGHELTHIEKKHALVRLRMEMLRRELNIDRIHELNTMSKMIESLVQLGYSEDMELEADAGAVGLTYRAGYDPRAAVEFIEVMAGPDPQKRQSRNPVAMGVTLAADTLKAYFATHPHWDKRKQRVLAEIHNLPEGGK